MANQLEDLAKEIFSIIINVLVLHPVYLTLGKCDGSQVENLHTWAESPQARDANKWIFPACT